MEWLPYGLFSPPASPFPQVPFFPHVSQSGICRHWCWMAKQAPEERALIDHTYPLQTLQGRYKSSMETVFTKI